MKWAKRLFWAVAGVATAIIAGWYLRRETGGWETLSANLGRVTPATWALLAAQTALFYWLDYLRYWTLLSLFGIRMGFWKGFKLTCVTYFVASLTPFSELSVPMIILILSAYGVPPSVAAAISLVRSLYLLFWVGLIALVSIALRDDVHLPGAVSDQLHLVSLPFIGLMLLLFAITVQAKGTHAWLGPRLARLPATSWKRRILGGLDHAATAVSSIGSSRQPMHLASHAVSISIVLVYVWIGWTSASAMGTDLPVGKALAVFSNSLLIAYVAPVPGSVGITEGATSYLMDPSTTEANMAAALILRVACWYLTWIPGPVWALQALFSWKKATSGVAPDQAAAPGPPPPAS